MAVLRNRHGCTNKRIGCSLYKALLSICRDFATNAPSNRGNTLSSNLQSLVKFRFRHDQRLQNLPRIRDSIEYGRKSLSLLQAACNGSLLAQEEILKTLRGAHELASSISATKTHCDKDKGNYALHVQKKQAYIAMVQDPITYTAPKPGAIPILSRPVPLSQIKSRRRRYPQLVVTHGIPFLRYHRRQPHALGAYLRREIGKGVKRWDDIHEMDALIQLGRYEDAWDEEVHASHDVADDDLDNPTGMQTGLSWTTDTWAARRETMQKSRDDERKRMAMGEKLYNIMLLEREMAMKEQQLEKEEKTKAKKAIKSNT